MSTLLNRIKQLVTTPPTTGNFTFASTPTGFAPFSVNGKAYSYTAWDGGSQWEVGTGIYSTSGTQMTRNAAAVEAGSAGAGVLVNFTNPVVVWGSVSAAQLNAAMAPFGYKKGFTLSNNATNVLNIAAGQITDSTGTESMVGAASNKSLASWTAGPGGGGLDTGTTGGAANTTYHVHVIKNPTTGAVDYLFSLSPTAPTLPAGFTLFQRAWSMLTDGSKNWQLFYQDENNFRWKFPTNEYAPYDFTGVAGTDVTLTARVPLGIRVRALINGQTQTNTGNPTLGMRAIDEDYNATGVQVWAGMVPGTATMGTRGQGIMTNTSGQYYARATASGGNFYYAYLGTLGWIDTA